jgi:hypothetical protein
MLQEDKKENDDIDVSMEMWTIIWEFRLSEEFPTRAKTIMKHLP